MAQVTQPVEPFGEVNVHKKADGSIDIVATILMVPDIEGARTGLALDASASMKNTASKRLSPGRCGPSMTLKWRRCLDG